MLIFEVGLPGGSKCRMEKTVPVHRVSFWKGVLRDYPLRSRWVLIVVRNKETATSKKFLFRPPSRRTPADRDSVFWLKSVTCKGVGRKGLF